MAQRRQRFVQLVGDARAALLGRAGGALPDQPDSQAVAADLPQAPDRQAVLGSERRQGRPAFRGRADDDAAGSFAEEFRGGWGSHGELQVRTEAAPDAAFRKRHRQAAAAHVLRRAQQPRVSRGQQEALQVGLALQVDGRRPIVRRGSGKVRVDRPGKAGDRLSDQAHDVTGRAEGGSDPPLDVIEEARPRRSAWSARWRRRATRCRD